MSLGAHKNATLHATNNHTTRRSRHWLKRLKSDPYIIDVSHMVTHTLRQAAARESLSLEVIHVARELRLRRHMLRGRRRNDRPATPG